ncbi:MAG: hypothetical protein H7066_03885 [Cytophagaceae bacterium]|nr:hypothetical protein [Gemmatimonadaceae bacterium]
MHDDVSRTATTYGAVLGVVFTGVGALLCYMLGLRGLFLVGGAIGIGVGSGWIIRYVALSIAEGAGRSILAFVQPSGKSSPYQQEFSQGQALAAADNIEGAIEWYDAEMARLPESVLVRIQNADLHARNGRPERAEALFLEARRLTSDRNFELYCTQRLIDLRLGALRDPARALPELRRLMERFPESREAAGAQIALARLKQELARES